MFPKPIVFTDYHHPALLYSLILLFEKRLGGSLFRPIGTDWYSKGFWQYSNYPDIVKNLLDIGEAVPLNASKLTDIEGNISDSIYLCKESHFTNKAITLKGFYQLPIDIMIATIPAHILPFYILSKLHPNKPKLIYQIGNDWPISSELAPNVMASALIKNVPDNINFITYHQEFDLSVFSPDFSFPGQNIYSFIMHFSPFEPLYKSDWQFFETIEKLMPDWVFKSYGRKCRDETLVGHEDVAKRMRDARFIWHTKNGGDGYGHVIYNAAAIARPLIVKLEYYQDKLGKELMIDGKTCISIDGLNPQEVVNKIQYYSEEKRYLTLCKNVYDNFKKVVDFDSEAKDLQNFIKGLI